MPIIESFEEQIVVVKQPITQTIEVEDIGVVENQEDTEIVLLVQETPIALTVSDVGSPGPMGPPGDADKAFVYEQQVAQTVWTIAHNLGKLPSVTIIDYGGNSWEGAVVYLDDNTLEVSFNVPFGGFAYLN